MQEKFVIAYVACGNARKAAIEVGYSPKSVRSASQILKIPHIAAAIEKRKQDLIDQAKYTPEKAMFQAQSAFDVAIKKENPIGMTKAVELMSNLSGFLDKGSKTNGLVPFSIVINREMPMIINRDVQEIEVTPIPQPAITGDKENGS